MGQKCAATSAGGEQLSHVLELQLYCTLSLRTFSSYLTSWWFPKKETNPSLVQNMNQGKISKILLEGILLISELACPQVELLGDLNKLLQVKNLNSV